MGNRSMLSGRSIRGPIFNIHDESSKNGKRTGIDTANNADGKGKAAVPRVSGTVYIYIYEFMIHIHVSSHTNV